MGKRFVLAVLAYLVPTFILGFAWHFWFFPRLYESLGIYNRPDPIIPLGFLSMLVQGLVVAYLFPFFLRGGSPVRRGVLFGVVMGAFLFSVSTLANAAKMLVSDLPAWLLVQAAFHAIQFVVAGALVGLVHRGSTAHVRERALVT